VKLNFQWKVKTGSYQSGSECFLGRIRVAQYSWNAARSKGSSEPDWVGSIGLPQTPDRFYAASEAEAKEKAELIITKWFKEAL
jgi:hypothetical protein